MQKINLFWRTLLLTLLFYCCNSFNTTTAQPDPSGNDMTFTEAYNMLLDMGFGECLSLVDFAEGATANDLFDYISTAGCQPALGGGGMPSDSTWNGGDPTGGGCGWGIEQEIAYLISIGLGACFEGAPTFTTFDELYAYLNSCPDYIDYITWDVNDEIEWISVAYPECFENAPQFASIDELYAYLNESCAQWIDDTTWDINDEIEWISAAYPECFENAPQFASVEELYAYLNESCAQWIDDTTWDINDEIEWISVAYPECFENAPQFASVEELYAYLYENCPAYYSWPQDTLIMYPYDPIGGGSPGDSIIVIADSLTVEEALAELIAQGFGDCLENAPAFADLQQLYDYFYTNCLNGGGFPGDSTIWGGGGPNDTIIWGGGDPLTVEEALAELIAQGFGDCLENAPAFADLQQLYDYFYTNCLNGGGLPGDTTIWGGGGPAGGGCGWTIEQEIEYLISIGLGECFDNSTTFTSFDDLYAYLNNCPAYVDYITWDINDEIEWIVQAGYGSCIEGMTFASVEELYTYLNENCAQWIDDMTWDINDEIEWISAAYPECFENAPQFASTEELYTYLSENCAQWIDDMTWDINDEIEWIVQAGYGSCIEGMTFASVEELYAYLNENCAQWIDDTTWDLSEAIEWVGGAGYGDCLINAPAFTSIEELYAYLETNCPLWIDDMTWDVNDEIEWIIQAGYGSCIEGMTFASIDELYAYLYANCDAFSNGGSPVNSVPDCLVNMPADIITVQGYLQYVLANCGADVLAGIPQCYFDAPPFATDEEFFAWVSENCTEGLAPMTDNNSGIMQNYYIASNGIPENNGNANSINNINTIGISLAPNPATDLVRLQSNDPIAQYQIFDLTGRLVIAKSVINADQTDIALQGLAKGMYVVKIQTTNGKLGTQKLTVQ